MAINKSVYSGGVKNGNNSPVWSRFTTFGQKAPAAAPAPEAAWTGGPVAPDGSRVLPGTGATLASQLVVASAFRKRR